MDKKQTTKLPALVAIASLTVNLSFGATNPLPPAPPQTPPPVAEGIAVSILNDSTDSELVLKIEGEVSSNDFGSGPVLSWVYLFTPGVEWSTRSFNSTLRNENFGMGNTAGEPRNYALFDGISLGTGVEDAIGIEFEEGHPIEVGDVIDWEFQVNAISPNDHDFGPLLTADSLQAQIYSGVVVPEASNFAWMASLTAFACVLLRRKR